MNPVVAFLLPPTLMCFILVGIHCYLGIHVLKRDVIFVDLALAQVAALGSTLAFLLGYEHSETMTYFISLGATLIAALFLALANRERRGFSQEALIGILYAFGSAAVILVIDQMSHGAEHLKEALVGQLLWVTWADVVKTAAIYLVVSIAHYIFRKSIFEASESKNPSWKWDFVFYALFGVVITSSVHIAGVLLVFSFLIVPAVMSSIFFKGVRARLFFGWGFGFVLSTLGMYLSYTFNLPSGALIVTLFTAVPLIAVLFTKDALRGRHRDI